VAFSPARDEFIDPFRGREEPRPPDPNPHPKKRIQEEPPPDAAPEPVFGYRSQLGAAASVDADYQCAQE